MVCEIVSERAADTRRRTIHLPFRQDARQPEPPLLLGSYETQGERPREPPQQTEKIREAKRKPEFPFEGKTTPEVVFYRQPSAGATNFKMLSMTCALYSTPS